MIETDRETRRVCWRWTERGRVIDKDETEIVSDREKFKLRETMRLRGIERQKDRQKKTNEEG